MTFLDTIRAWRTRPEDELDSILTSGFDPETDPELESVVQSLAFDRVLDVARREQLLPYHIVARLTPTDSWRDVVTSHPAIADTLRALAARIYGYKSILICEMGSLVLADLLASRTPAPEWKQLFDAGLVPVVEHGHKPTIGSTVTIASFDPSSREVRRLAEAIPFTRPDIVYADQTTILAIQRDMAVCVPAVSRVFTVDRPQLKKVILADDTGYSKAA